MQEEGKKEALPCRCHFRRYDCGGMFQIQYSWLRLSSQFAYDTLLPRSHFAIPPQFCAVSKVPMDLTFFLPIFNLTKLYFLCRIVDFILMQRKKFP